MDSSHPSRNWLQDFWRLVGWTFSPVVACVEIPFKAAHVDLQMAVALWNYDPDRVRGRACSLFYLVSASSKVMMTGMGLAGLFFLITFAGFGGLLFGFPLVVECCVALFIAGVIGAALIFVTGVVAVVYAHWHRQRIWIDMHPYPALILDGHWPPFTDSKNNGAQWIAGLPILIGMGVAALLIDRSLLAVYSLAMLAVVAGLFIVRPVIARQPNECYWELLDADDV